MSEVDQVKQALYKRELKKVERLEALVKQAYLEGWEMGWVTRHGAPHNDSRVCPWLPPQKEAQEDWLESSVQMELQASKPPNKQLKVM